MSAMLRKHSVSAMAIVVSLTLVGLATVSALNGGTSNPSGLNFGSSVYERTTLSNAQLRLAFHILQPEVLPQGYDLAFVQVPRQQPDHVLLVYASQMQPGRDFTISESATTSEMDRGELSRGGSTEQVIVDGHSAIYVKGIPSQKQGDPATAMDENGHELFIERSGVWVHLIGWRDAGVDKAMFIQIAASLK